MPAWLFLFKLLDASQDVTSFWICHGALAFDQRDRFT